jgi:hypothetical protein
MEDKNRFRETVHDCQSFGFASDGETLALEVHRVSGAGFIGGVASEESSVSEASLTLFILAVGTVLQPTTNVRMHGWPEVVPGEGGTYLGVGKVV